MNADMIKEQLDEILTQSWELLGRGGADGKDAFHTPTLLTRGEEFPEARTVILRQVLRPERRLLCYSDVRAAKVAQIEAHPAVSWHLWHPRHRIQLRLYAQATVHRDDAVADQAWEQTTPASRLNYGAQISPGQTVESLQEALQAHSSHDELDQTDTEAWRPHFCVIDTQVHRFEYLMLSREGHRRACFSWQGDGWQGRWMVP